MACSLSIHSARRRNPEEPFRYDSETPQLRSWGHPLEAQRTCHAWVKATRPRGDETGHVHFACLVIGAFRKYGSFATVLRVKHSGLSVVPHIREASHYFGQDKQLRRAAITLYETLHQKDHAILFDSSLIDKPEERLGKG